MRFRSSEVLQFNFTSLILSLISVSFVLLVSEYTHAEDVFTLKFGTVAPPGSTWSRHLRKYANIVEARTEGKVTIIFYLGGVKGDEPVIVEKIKTGQLHGGALTGVGLGKAIPPVGMLELPFMFRNYKEVDFIRDKLDGLFDKLAARAGFKVLGWGEAGFVHIFSSKPIRSLDDVKRLRMWVWAGDPVPEAIAEALSDLIIPVRLPIVSVAEYMDRLDMFYNVPYATIAFGWFAKAKYMVSQPITFAPAGLAISKDVWDRLTEDAQQILLEEAKRMSEESIKDTRKENELSIEALKVKNGMKITKVKEEELRKLKRILEEKVYLKLAGKLYPSWLLSEVRRALIAFRARGE
jgi:TRAP-type C4-dicarboxylate transport system substrate-binding protein